MRALPLLSLFAALLALVPPARADENNGIFAQGLIDGYATATVEAQRDIARMVQAFQQQTHDTGSLVIEVRRLFRFKQQSRCGRVTFVIRQPSSNTTMPVGGQMNVCEDGMPPWRACPGVTELVPPDSRCPDGSASGNTPEVAAAIRDAVNASGGESPEQVMQKLKTAADQRKKVAK